MDTTNISRLSTTDLNNAGKVAADEATRITKDTAEFVETETKSETTTVKRGALVRFLTSKPVKIVLAVGAVAGAGYVVYEKVRDGADAEDVTEGLETAVAALRALAK